MKQKAIQCYISGRLAIKIIQEAAKIGEEKNPSFWVLDHLYKHFKFDDKDKNNKEIQKKIISYTKKGMTPKEIKKKLNISQRVLEYQRNKAREIFLNE